ncbi:uncharacterized protein LOC130695276 [Daphnia carinata]|uniref:uncharacterized protein LOC130695276 n=1 Tax=Daphnia carinata TaxID=120202 RepID=UPI00257FA826|nr:uncharacterized protein LOC130695276 [Daphnia carinata]
MLSSLLFFLFLALPSSSTSDLAMKLDLIHRELASVNPSWNRVLNFILESNQLNTNKDLGQNNDDNQQCCWTGHSGWWCRRRRHRYVPIKQTTIYANDAIENEGHLHSHGDNLPTDQLGHRSARPAELYEATDWNCLSNKTAEVGPAEVASLSTPRHHVDAPAIFSILMNFGRNEYYQFLLSMLDYLEEDHACPEGYVWDPFASACRRVYCGPRAIDGFMKDACANTTNGTQSDWRMTYIMELNLIQLTLYVDAIYDVHSISDDALIAIIQQSFTSVFASFVGISPGRITNLHVEFLNESSRDVPGLRSLTLDFWLSQAEEGSDEPTIDSVVSLMGSLIVQDRLIVVIDGVVVQLIGLHEQPVSSESDSFANWCRGGITAIYHNDEFLIEVNTTETNQTELIVYIKATDQWYSSGEYMADLFFYGSTDSELTSLSGSVAVCENRSVLLDASCNVVRLNETEFIFLDNNTVLYNGTTPFIDPVLQPGEYESLPDGGLAVCLYIEQDWPMALIIESYLTLCLMTISVMAMSATIITYILFPELRNLAGLAVMNLCLMTSGFQLCVMIGMSISVHSEYELCVAASIIAHYEGLASIFWTNVMAVDLYLTLGRWSAVPRKPSKILPRYALYAYGLPLVIVSIAVAINFCNCTGEFNVDYGRLFCWISNPTANMIFFGLPLALALLANIFLFIRTVAIIQGSSACHQCSRRQKALCQLKLYARMSTVMGFTWIFAFISAFFNPSSTAGMIFTFTYIILNAMGGLFIFVAFTCNRRVYQLYSDWWARRRNQFMRQSSTTADSVSRSSNKKTVPSEQQRRNNRQTKTISIETLVSNSDEQSQRETSHHM